MSSFGGGSSGGGGGGGPTTIAGPLGNHTKAESVSVTLSTNEPAVPVSGTVTANIGTSGSLALDASVTAIGAKLGTLGQKAMAGSAPVVIASDQSAIPVTGSFSNPSVGTNGSAIPTSSTQVAGSDGTNLQVARVFDLDTGGGTEYDLGVSIRLPGSGGSVAGGTSTNPVRVDPTGTTTQPVSGTVTANIGTSGSLALDATVSSMSAKLPATLGQTNMAGSMSVTIASNQSTITVDTELPAAGALADATANPTTTSVGIFGHIFNGTTWDRIRGGLNTAVSSVTGWLNVLPGGKYNASQATLTDGQYTVAQLDSLGNQRSSEQFAPVAEDNTNGVIAVQIKPLTVSTYAPSITNDWGSNVTLNVKASAGTTFSAIGVNRNAGTRYLQLHNTATTPSTAAVPLISFPVPTNSILFIGNDLLTNNGIFFSTGIAYAWSTTAGTYTAATASEHDTTVLFK